MPAISRLGDRRTAIRFEIVGELWGTLQVAQAFRVLNVGEGGMLIASPVPLSVGARYEAQITVDRQARTVPVRVTRVRPVAPAASACTVGVEFLDLPADLRRELDRITRDDRGRTASKQS